MAYLSNSNYNVRMTGGAEPTAIHPIAFHNKYKSSPKYYPRGRHQAIMGRSHKIPRNTKTLHSKKESFLVTGRILLHDRIGELCKRALFVVVENWLVDLLLGIIFIGRFVKNIFPGSTNRFPETHLRWPSSSSTTCPSHCKDREDQTKSTQSAPVPVSKGVNVASLTQHLVSLSANVTGLAHISPLQPDAKNARTKVVPVHGVIDVASKKPSRILVSDFSYQTMKLRKGDKTSMASRRPDCTTQLIE